MADGVAGAQGEQAGPMHGLDLLAGLRRLGHDTFRPGQREAIDTLLERGRLLLVAPTGGGKSLTYQLPACLLPGTTLVVSPLIALMHDQVAALQARGVAATFLASTLEAGELRQRMSELARGAYQLAYVAPERLAFPGFRALLGDLDCPLVAIDEAHCISEWGHDFRPEYMQIGELLDGLDVPRVLACTATATPIVRDEILARLHLPPDTPQLLRGFARPNLALRAAEVGTARERQGAIDEALAEALGAPGQGRGTAIVYAPTRKTAEQEQERLAARGWRSDCYHAGLSAGRRESSQRAFAAGELEVVVATNAFGMGIDRADVRLVAHFAPPSSIEAYYQEVGRAGRDGQPAIGLLLVGPSDFALRRRFLDLDAEQGVDEDLIKHKWNLFLELMRWVEGGSCRHDAILRYFGDEAETLAGCGRCDICLGLQGSESDADEVALVVRKALSGVARVHGRFGTEAAARLLKGVDDDRLARAGLDGTSTFGVLAERSLEWILRLLRRLITAGWVDLSGGERPVLLLTDEGREVMWGRREARLLLPSEHAPAKAGKDRRARQPARTPGAAADELPFDEQLFEALRRHRLECARTAGIPPYVVASDRTLRDLARRRPGNEEQLLEVFGIGPAKVERYGRGFLDVVAGRTSQGA